MPDAERSTSGLERPGPLTVASRVYAGCVGWGMLTGLVAGGAYLGISVGANGDPDIGPALVIGSAYGAMTGLLAGAVLGLGAAAGAGLRARTGSVPSTAMATRAAFLGLAAVVLLAWRLLGDSTDRWLEWRVVSVVALSLAFGAWRAGRTAKLAMTPRETRPGLKAQSQRRPR